LIWRAGERDFGLSVIVRGEVEVFETRDREEQILATWRARG